MKKLILIILFSINALAGNALADFDSEWINIQNTDKSSFIGNSKESAKSSIATESLGVKENEVNSFVNSTPQDGSSLESKGNSAYFTSDDPSIQALRSSHDSTNENNPETKKYLKAADQIIGDTEKMLKAGILDYIKSETGLDVNCVPIEGKSHLRDDPYVVGLDKEVASDPVYEPFLCEKRFNKYDCKDTLHLRCLQKGFGYRDWQYKTIKFSGHTLHSEKMNWGLAIKWKNKRWGWHITPHHFQFSGNRQVDSPWRHNPELITNDARHYIASKTGVMIEQIREDIVFPSSGRGIGNITPVYYRWRVVWDEYEFGYWYRDAYPICLNWHKEWREECTLQKY